MFDGKKIISVTPAGRAGYIDVLYRYLLKNQGIIDEHHFWINTKNRSDIIYIENLCKKHSFFKAIYPKIKINGIWSIHHFFRYCTDKNTVFIRFDDDVCYIANDAVCNLLEFRISNQKYFLVYPHIINNSANAIMGKIGQTKFKGNWYHSGKHAEDKHNLFLDTLDKGELNSFKCSGKEVKFRANINCISWMGEEFAKFGGIVGIDEENWLTRTYLRKTKKLNYIIGTSIVSHFAFKTQRRHLESTAVFDRYKKLILPSIKLL